jgi:predicted nucleotidyltransferase
MSMLETLFGSLSAERVLQFLVARGQGYATEIARVFDTDLSPIQNQLERLEQGGLLKHAKVGRKKVYRLDPEYPLAIELESLVSSSMLLLPDELREQIGQATDAPLERDTVIRLLGQSKRELEKRYGVKRLALFGSAARNTARADSDVDVLVAFDGPATSERYFGVQFYLEDMLGRPVDLVTERALRPELKAHVERDRINV